jgi:hypothetical protein
MSDIFESRAEERANNFVARIKDGTFKKNVAPNRGNSPTKEHMQEADVRYKKNNSSELWKEIEDELQKI